MQTLMYGQLEKLGDALNVVLEAFKGLNPLIVRPYGEIANMVPGHQAHHLNQDAAFERDEEDNIVIPSDKGLAIALWGNILTQKDSPHYKAHQVLQTFWEPFRKTGTKPSNRLYGRALVKSLKAAGFSPDEANAIAAQAAAQRSGKPYFLTDVPETPVPNVPERIRSVQLLNRDI